MIAVKTKVAQSSSVFVHRETEKKEPVFFCVHLFNARQKLVNFFTCIKESLSHNSVYLILARVKDFV